MLQRSNEIDAAVVSLPQRKRTLNHRTRLEPELTPRLRQILQDELPRVYDLTRRTTERQLRLFGRDAATDALPATPPLHSRADHQRLAVVTAVVERLS